MKFVDKASVLLIQFKLIERYGGIHGLRDEAILESALMAAENRFYKIAFTMKARRLKF